MMADPLLSFSLLEGSGAYRDSSVLCLNQDMLNSTVLYATHVKTAS